jgi:hypothetical protein
MSCAMLNFSSPDQKFSEQDSIVHSTSNVKFFQPGSEIQKNSGQNQTIDVMCNVKFFQPGSKILRTGFNSA